MVWLNVECYSIRRWPCSRFRPFFLHQRYLHAKNAA
jgi:hypothetical protein